MNRRAAISRITFLLGGAVSAPTLSALLSGCKAPSGDGYALQRLTGVQFELVGRLAESIIPETDTPGAIGAGVDRFIDNLLSNYYSEQDSNYFVSSLDAFSMAFSPESMSDADLQLLVAKEDAKAFGPVADSTEPSIRFFRWLKEMVVSGYYTSEVGMTQELRMMPFGTGRLDIPRSDVERAWSKY